MLHDVAWCCMLSIQFVLLFQNIVVAVNVQQLAQPYEESVLTEAWVEGNRKKVSGHRNQKYVQQAAVS